LRSYQNRIKKMEKFTNSATTHRAKVLAKVKERMLTWVFSSSTLPGEAPALPGGSPLSLRVIRQESTTRRACAVLGGPHGFAPDHLRQGAVIVSFITILFLTCCYDGERKGGRHKVAWAIDVWHRRSSYNRFKILSLHINIKD
jgi:hypothetical protein